MPVSMTEGCHDPRDSTDRRATAPDPEGPRAAQMIGADLAHEHAERVVCIHVIDPERT